MQKKRGEKGDPSIKYCIIAGFGEVAQLVRASDS